MPTLLNVNDQIINYQTGQLLADIVGQATGTSVLAPVTNSQFVSVANVALKCEPDVLLNAVSQVLSRTIFSIRPYSAKFKGLLVDQVRYGNHVRKLNVVDKPFRDDDRYDLTDGYSKDPWLISKPEIVQTNYYGQVAVEKCITRFRDQLNIAFSSPDELMRFVTMIMQNVSDMLEQERESVARATVGNLITGVYAQATAATPIAAERVIYLVDEYNTAKGLQLTAAQIKTPTYFGDFARWLFGYLKTLADKISNRSALFHQNFTIDSVAKIIMRHTPVDRAKCYLYGPLFNEVSANVLSMTFYTDYLKLMDHEMVDFWQSITDGMKLDMIPVYTDTDGTLTSPQSAVELNNVLGVIFDEEAAGLTEIEQWAASSPFNARGGYATEWFHENIRYWNDFTENVIVLLLDTATPASEGGAAAAGNNREAIRTEDEPAPVEEPEEPADPETKSVKKSAKK